MGASAAILEDHAAYSRKLLDELAAEARRAAASALVTTEKDHVKLTGFEMPARLWRLAVRMDVTDGAEALAERIAVHLGKAPNEVTIPGLMKIVRQRQGDLVLAGINDRVRGVFEIARLPDVFHMAPSVEEALEP